MPKAQSRSALLQHRFDPIASSSRTDRNIYEENASPAPDGSVLYEVNRQIMTASPPEDSDGFDDCPILKSVVNTGSFRGYDTAAKKWPSLKNYLFLVRLPYTDHPRITRLLSVPSNLNFTQLHIILQIAFGWKADHAWSFMIMIRAPSGRMIDFVSEGLEARKLSDIFDKAGNDAQVQCQYKYDFGDNWEHEVSFLGVSHGGLLSSLSLLEPPSRPPKGSPIVCISGEGHPCAEDCGGAACWEVLKELFAKKDMPDPDKSRPWYRTQCANGNRRGLDPWKWNMRDVNKQLAAFGDHIFAE